MESNITSNHSKLKGRVLYAGHSYYHAWYLSRELRKIGWHADVLNWEPHLELERYYHGEDFYFDYKHPNAVQTQVDFYFWAVDYYDVFHFCNKTRMNFGPLIHQYFIDQGFPPYTELDLLKERGKKIVYANNGCMDGVLHSSFQKWQSPEGLCNLCRAKENPEVCSDRVNREWGIFRNHYADYQINIGGNRQDFNDFHTVHEVPQFYNMSEELWHPNLEIPAEYKLDIPEDTFKLYHAVGNYDSRTMEGNRNIKSTHVWMPLVQRLKSEGYKIELIFCHDKPSKVVRYYQAQADVIGEMLSFGYYGSTGREGMMLGKPVICYMRPEWLVNIEKELPEFIETLPIVQADPTNVYDVLIDLIKNPEKRIAIGKKSREFALRWHSAKAAANKMDEIYSELLGLSQGDSLEPVRYATSLKYAECDLLSGEYDSAKAHYERLNSRFPGSDLVIKGLATSLFHLGEVDKVIELLNNLSSQDKTTINLTAQCAEKLNNLSVANELYRVALQMDSADPQALAGLKRTMQA